MAKPTHKAVCAIDFGTTFSGFSFSLADDPDKVYIKNDWGLIAGIPGVTKTPTCLLKTQDGEIKVGYDAVKAFNDMTKEDAKQARYFDRFKMKLYEKNAGKVTPDTEIADQAGKSILARDVFALVLEEMKKTFLGQINKQFAGEIDEEDVKWVVTVPAIWTDGAKQFMREAAKQGKLVEDADSDKLLIALEPEAASIECQRLPVESLRSAAGSSEMPVGTQFLVLDAGGGTLDITIHEVLPDKKLQEVYVVSGTEAGGAQIDAKFIELLDDMFEKPFMDKFKEKNSPAFVDFMHKFETTKKSFEPGTKLLSITIPAGMTELYEDEYGPHLRHAIKKEYANKGVTIVGGIMRIPKEVMMTVFCKTVTTIVNYVKDLLGRKELKKVKSILMVGGLSCSLVLQEKIKEEFGSEYNIVIPDDASSVVVKGASIFGHQPHAIHSRIARMTYGTEMASKFDGTRHQGAKTAIYGGVKHAIHVFNSYIKHGEKVERDSCVTKSFFPLTSDQQSILFKFFTTMSTTSQYTTEPGMEEIGRLIIDIPGTGMDREVELSMKFGGTNIEVSGKYKKTNVQVKTTLDFLSK